MRITNITVCNNDDLKICYGVALLDPFQDATPLHVFNPVPLIPPPVYRSEDLKIRLDKCSANRENYRASYGGMPDMKISGITFIKTEDLPKQQRKTEMASAVEQISQSLAKVPNGQSLAIAGEFEKYTRYALQKRLQEKGHKVLVSAGQHPQSKTPCLFIKRLTDAEWREWVKS